MSQVSMAKQGPEHDAAAALLAWYDAHARDLPWRAKGRAPDPYHVWLSEIMLQQTTVAAVKAYFLKFLALWPTVKALAAVDLDDVLRAWAGLGYYARARNLHACAKVIVQDHGGSFPAAEAALRTLPGVGPYTAAAIAAIAFDGRHAAVDGNVERVISRYYAITAPLPDSKPLIRQLAQALVPDQRSGDFAQAMMDLGATICTPKSPNCLICPWAAPCQGREQGIAAELPKKRAKKAIPTRQGIAYWVEHDGRVLLRRRPEKGLLGGMMEVPSTAWAEGKPVDNPPLRAHWRKLVGQVEHTFTHFHLVLDVRACTHIEDGELLTAGDLRWVPLENLADEALPTVMRKVVALAQKAG